MAKFKSRGWANAGHPPIELAAEPGGWRLGEPEGEPIAALETSDFELPGS